MSFLLEILNLISGNYGYKQDSAYMYNCLLRIKQPKMTVVEESREIYWTANGRSDSSIMLDDISSNQSECVVSNGLPPNVCHLILSSNKILLSVLQTLSFLRNFKHVEFNAHALGALAKVAGAGLNLHLNTVLPALLSAMSDDNMNVQDLAKMAAETVLLVIDEEGIDSLISELIKGSGDSKASIRRSASYLISHLFENNKLYLDDEAPSEISHVLSVITSLSAVRESGKGKCPLSVANLHMVHELLFSKPTISRRGSYGSVYNELFRGGQAFNMGISVAFAMKIGSWKLADVQPVPDSPAIQGDGDEQSSSSSEFFRVRTPTEDRDGVVEQENLEADREENHRKWLEETKTILVYEELEGELLLRSEFTMLGTNGYASFARKLRDCYPEDGNQLTSVRLTLPHVLWPWWPHYGAIYYIGANGRQLNPPSMKWDVFKAEIHHAIVHAQENDNAVVLLRKYDDGEHQGRAILHIPKNSFTTSWKLDYIIHFYHSAYLGREPYDDGVLPLDPWPLYTISYMDGDAQLIDRPHLQPYLEPFEQQGIGEDLKNLLEGNEGEGGEVGGNGVEQDDVEEEQVDENEEESAEWQQFTTKLRFVDLHPIPRMLQQ